MEFADQQGDRIENYAYAENRELRVVSIPEETRYIGRHAFYNCRNLEEIYLPHGNIEIGDGAFKNCERLTRIFMEQGDSGCTCLKDIMYDLNQEITVSISYQDEDAALLLFPHYEYEYIANEPARIFSEVGYGIGYLYQQCFYDSQPDYVRYDSLWPQARIHEDTSVLARIFSWRLRFPHGLSEKAMDDYLSFWNQNTQQMLEYFIEMKERDALRFFLGRKDKPNPDASALALEIAHSKEDPEMIGFLLNMTRRESGSDGNIQNRFAL